MKPLGYRYGALGSAIVGCVVVLLWLESSAQAQYQLDRYQPAELARDGFSVRRPTDQGHMKLGAQLQLAYSLNPLVLEADQGVADSEAYSVVAHQLMGHALVSLGLWDRVIVFGHLPVVLAMDGDGDFAGLSADGAGLSDLGVGLRLRLFGKGHDLFGLAVQTKLTLPTAELLNGDQQLSGDASVVVHPELIAEVRPGPLRISANLGTRVRSFEEVPTVDTGSELTFGLGLSLPLYNGAWRIRGYAETFGTSTFEAFGSREETSLELLGGLKALSPGGWVAGLAAGPGLGRGVGAPDLRVIGMVGYQPWSESRAPSRDRCPNEDEDVDGFEDEDGCPDPDNDQDQILDPADDCPMDPEDVDGFEDDDGCPDLDNDQDGYIDASDACPFQLGEGDGCPDTKPVVTVAKDRIQFPKVYFETDQARILPESLGILSEVARTLNDHPEILLVRINGHTDKRGTREYNQDLSRRRAQSVRTFLIHRGVDGRRMEIRGHGFDRPNFKNATTLKQYAINRRVEIYILQTADTDNAVRDLYIEENEP